MANTLTNSGGAAAALVFESTTFDVVDQQGQQWLKSGQLAQALVPVFTGTLQGQSVQLCDARTLHTFMVVLRDFSDWIKGRIRKFGFLAGVDFIAISRSPEKGSGNRGAAIDYHLTLDMAKELSMVENNAKGREARRYFMECEKQVLAALSTGYTLPAPAPYSVNPADTLTKAQADTLRDMLNDACNDLAKDLHGTFMREGWSKLKSHFKVGYREIPQSQFNEAVSLVTRHIVYFNGTKVKALPSPDAPSLKNRRWLVSFNPIDGREIVEPVPTDAMVLNWGGFTRAIESGECPAHELLPLTLAASTKLYESTFKHSRGYGEEVSKKIDRDFPQSDLYTIAMAVNMELMLRATGADMAARKLHI